ncbi:MAG: sulfotransferase [Actinobacteria bacterium]|nr:sulfotransferase [Actinomycetota bacterium]
MGDLRGEQAASLSRVVARLAAHVERLRQEDLHSVLVDDVRRGRALLRRTAWGATHNCSPNATPVYIVGLMRSGTNMLLGAFSQASDAEIHNEAMDSRAFTRWALRDDQVVRSLIERSRHRYIVFKPLVDAHRVVHLMEGLGVPSPGRAVWIYRNVADRVRSVYAWSEDTGEVGRKIARGYRGWETGGLSEEQLAVARRFDPETMTPASGAALFWYLRNSLFFDLELDRRPDVALMSYDRFVTEPERFMAGLCDFTGIRYRHDMVSGIARQPPPTPKQLEIDPEIATLCGDLQRRLDEEFERRIASGTTAGGRLIEAR